MKLVVNISVVVTCLVLGWLVVASPPGDPIACGLTACFLVVTWWPNDG